ncbi:hypothetical protein [Komagataeibacter europaeus]|uniref:hypothetical protein n=1 Tax=Komagataeibacter europaeus TaxID=33995 RepID=UPI0006A74EF6|nr:hypothetical protein [Komagataeibacter europaeus]
MTAKPCPVSPFQRPAALALRYGAITRAARHPARPRPLCHVAEGIGVFMNMTGHALSRTRRTAS